MTPTKKPGRLGLLPIILLLGLLLMAVLVYALPEGPTITSYGNSNRTAINGSGPRIDTKGSINYVNLDAETQNQRWKAYVGNVTGTFVLQDAGGSNIYSWPAGTSISGEVFASRNNSILWTQIGCANGAAIAVEQTILSFTHQSVDSINRTFNSTEHDAFTIGAATLDNCSTVYTYSNSLAQTWNDTSNIYQEVLLNSSSDALVYTTLIETNEVSYDNGVADFQMIVPDKGNVLDTVLVQYYFYVELS